MQLNLDEPIKIPQSPLHSQKKSSKSSPRWMLRKLFFFSSTSSFFLFFIYKELHVINLGSSNSGYAGFLPNWLDRSVNHHTLGISRSPTLLSSSSLAPSLPPLSLFLTLSLSYCGGLQCSPSPDWSAVIGLTLLSSARGGISFSSASVLCF